MNRGFLIIAQNTVDTDYVKCAVALAMSIKRVMPNEKIALISNDKLSKKYKKYFDYIIPLPHGDLDPKSNWKLINDWQVYEASPFDYTIKLEADMYVPTDISYWFDILKSHDLILSTTIRNFKQEVSHVRAYRRFIDDNKLPDVYNAITYYKKSELAERFFKIVRNIFENWVEYRNVLKCNPNEEATTDWVYALAAHIIGVGKCTLPSFTEMSMVHMKQYINDLPTEDWSKTLIYEILPHTLRINSFPQLYPFHYNVKRFSDKILESYE